VVPLSQVPMEEVPARRVAVADKHFVRVAREPVLPLVAVRLGAAPAAESPNWPLVFRHHRADGTVPRAVYLL